MNQWVFFTFSKSGKKFAALTGGKSTQHFSPPWRAAFKLYLGDFYTKIYYKSRGFTCSPPQARKFWGFRIKVRKFASFFGISENIFGWVLFQNLKIRKYFRWVLFQIFEIRKDFEKKNRIIREKKHCLLLPFRPYAPKIPESFWKITDLRLETDEFHHDPVLKMCVL